MNWQPIETIPKDDTWVLLGGYDDMYPKAVCIGCWSTHFHCLEPFDQSPDFGINWKPIYWMAIPDLPNKKPS